MKLGFTRFLKATWLNDFVHVAGRLFLFFSWSLHVGQSSSHFYFWRGLSGDPAATFFLRSTSPGIYILGMKVNVIH